MSLEKSYKFNKRSSILLLSFGKKYQNMPNQRFSSVFIYFFGWMSNNKYIWFLISLFTVHYLDSSSNPRKRTLIISLFTISDICFFKETISSSRSFIFYESVLISLEFASFFGFEFFWLSFEIYNFKVSFSNDNTLTFSSRLTFYETIFAKDAL